MLHDCIRAFSVALTSSKSLRAPQFLYVLQACQSFLSNRFKQHLFGLQWVNITYDRPKYSTLVLEEWLSLT